LTLVRGLSRAQKILPSLIVCATIALLVQNFIILRENRDLRSKPVYTLVSAGKRIKDLAGLTLDGKARRVEMTGPGLKVLVIAYSPSCPFCRANQKAWEYLDREVKNKGWSVVWLSRDPVEITRPYCMRTGIPLSEAIAEPTVRTYLQLGLVSVPGTIVIGADGIVQKVWSGELHSDGWRQLSKYFGLEDFKSESRNPALGADLHAMIPLGVPPRSAAN
jgi:peroxiredoxin